MNDLKEKIQQVNELLRKGEPNNISVDDYMGYTGYDPQPIIDAMNAELWGTWGFEELHSEIIDTDKGQLAISHCRVWLAGVEFSPTAWGQSNVTRGAVGDARKGAQTDAIKKALSYFSIGNRAYLGLLVAPPKSNQNGNASKSNYNNQQRPAPKPQNANNYNGSVSRHVEAENSSSRLADELATEQQKNAIRSLCARLDTVVSNIDALSKEEAGKVIADLNSMPREQKPESTSTQSEPIASQVRNRFDALLDPDKWQSAQQQWLGITVVEGEMSPDQCQKMWQHLNVIEQQRRKAKKAS